MHITTTYLFFMLCLWLLFGCKSFRENAKYELNEGYYKARTEGGEDRRVYLYATEDTLLAYPQLGMGSNKRPDTTAGAAITFPRTLEGTPRPAQIFHAYSFDLDVLAIPFKYRPSRETVPRQLNTQFSGALYAGFRTDRYRVSYPQTPLGIAGRTIAHYGYSIGYFSGIAAEPINPWVTRDQHAGEYDGVVWQNGLAGIIGINNFTFGLGLGVDYLLDSNRRHWIYQTKPWLGLTVGLNLN
jgi:hypothetical protein